MISEQSVQKKITGYIPVIFGCILIGYIVSQFFIDMNIQIDGTIITMMGDNRHGQLGNSDSSLHLNILVIPGQIQQISAGFGHMLGLTKSGQVWAWGDNNYGQIGIASPKGIISTPTRIETLSEIVQVAGGFRHSLALDNSGQVWAWGDNIAGQLGDQTREYKNTPVKVLLPGRVRKIVAGHRFSVALLEDGRVYAWGANCGKNQTTTFVELMRLIGESAKGISYYVDATADPTEAKSSELCQFEGFVPISSIIPTELPAFSGSVSLVAGFGHILALQRDGTVKSAGCNAYGQVGRPQLEITPGEIIPELRNIVALSANTRHSLALDNSGQVWAWGDNHMGELGRDDRPDSITPLRVRGLPEIRAITTGHDSSYALDTNGQLWVWGSNTYDQLSFETGAIRLLTPTLSNITGLVTIEADGGFIFLEK